jgi:hypothetical protein
MNAPNPAIAGRVAAPLVSRETRNLLLKKRYIFGAAEPRYLRTARLRGRTTSIAPCAHAPHYEIPISLVADTSRNLMALSATLAPPERLPTPIHTHPRRRPIGKARDRQRRVRRDGELSMLDILMAAIALAFFALSVGYAYACDRL